MKRIISLLMILIALFALVCCTQPAGTENVPGASSPETEPVTVTDMIGREVQVRPGAYKRVVCIGAGALRMYSYIGDILLLCGVEDIDNLSLEARPKMFDLTARPYLLAYKDDFAKLPSCGVGGPNAQSAEAEKILSCAPDIVISEYEDVDKENALQEQLGIPVITLRSGWEGVFGEAFQNSLTLLGRVFCKEERASALISFIDNQRAEISRRTSDIPEESKPAAYICGLGNWGTTNHLMTSQNYTPFIVANVKNAVSGLSGNGAVPLEKEAFTALGRNVDIVFIDSAAIKNIAPLYKEDPALFDSFKAFQTGEVYLEMAYNAYYTNYELALANTWFIAKTVYPERFEDVDMTAKVDEITNAFLEKNLAQEIFSCPASFGGYVKFDPEKNFG